MAHREHLGRHVMFLDQDFVNKCGTDRKEVPHTQTAAYLQESTYNKASSEAALEKKQDNHGRGFRDGHII